MLYADTPVAGGMCIARAGSAASRATLRTLARVSAWDTRLDQLGQHLEGRASARRQFIQEEHSMVGPRHLTLCGDLTAADQPHIRNGVVGGTTRAW